MAEDDEGDDLVTPRPFWSGTIAFGLVSLPVSLFPANRGRPLTLKMVTEDGTPLARRYFCEAEQKPLSRDEIVRGYEIEDGEHVLVEDAELESLAPDKSREIDLNRFVQLDRIDPMYFERAYYLTPDEGATKAYRLLARSMEDEGRAGIATFVMRGKEYLCTIVAENGILRAETLRFHDELRSAEEVGLPQPKEPPKARVDAIEKAMRALAADRFEREELTDAYVERVREHVERKLERDEDVVHAPEQAAVEPSGDTNIVDLMQVLKERLQGTSAAEPARTPPTHTHRRKPDGNGKQHGKQNGGRDGRRATRTRDRLSELSKSELYDRAQALDLAGRSQMSKDQLIAALRKHGR